ncbi:MAG: hypothetical protein ACK5N4_05335 [Parabacteroides gordonii]|uniref:hypothetical protein n=1 Tax=Parabacteroides gordonii TaxID=574930 RepID=UPI003A8C3B69
MEDKKERTVVHVEYMDRHYYFGSMAAIYTMFTPEQIGIALGTLRNYRLNEHKPYSNDKCIIRKGVLKTIPKG